MLTLVALAAVSAVSAFAQTAYQPSGINPNPAWGTGVSIIGAFDVGYGALNYKGNNKVSTVMHNGSTTSQIDFVGVMDLGGGTKADFFFENDIIPTSYITNPGVGTLNGTYAAGAYQPNAGTPSSAQAVSTWGNGQVKAGIGGSLGYLAVGAPNHATLDFNQYTNPFGTSIGGGYGVTIASIGYGSSAKVRFDNSARYLTPTVNGLTGSLTYRPKASAGNNSFVSTTPGLQAQSGVQELGAIYGNGPVNAIFVSMVEDGNGINGADGVLVTSGSKKTTNSLGTNYTMGGTTLYAAYQNQKSDTTLNNKAYRYAVKYMLSPVFSLSGVYSYANKGSNNTKTTLSAVGGEYALSKTVAVYGKYETVSDGAGLISSVESNGGADSALATPTTANNAGFTSGTGTQPNITRTRAMVGLRVGF